MEKHKGTVESRHNAFTEALDRQKVAHDSRYNNFEAILQSEKRERASHHGTIQARMGSMEKVCADFDGLFREDRREREAEVRRLWDAVDNHTHDLEGNISDEEEKPRVVRRLPSAAPPTVYTTYAGSPTPAARFGERRQPMVSQVYAAPPQAVYSMPGNAQTRSLSGSVGKLPHPGGMNSAHPGGIVMQTTPSQLLSAPTTRLL